MGCTHSPQKLNLKENYKTKQEMDVEHKMDATVGRETDLFFCSLTVQRIGSDFSHTDNQIGRLITSLVDSNT